MDCYGIYYGYEETSFDGSKITDAGIDLGEKCIITVYPGTFGVYKINEHFDDKKGNGLDHAFYPSQLVVNKREVQEGAFLFKKRYYILDLTFTYNNYGRTRICKHTVKVKERDGENILTTIEK